MRARNLLIFLCAVVLTGCAASETRSVVSKDELPASKHRKVALFIEKLNQPESQATEQIVIAALQKAGGNAESGANIFARRGMLTEQAKAKVVQKEFDAVIYLTVLEKGIFAEIVPNAWSDGQTITYSMLGLLEVSHNVTDLYVVRSDGTVYQQMLTLKMKVDLQDTKTAKQVWTSETVSSGNVRLTNMDVLFGEASQQITEKMKTDNAI